MIAAAVALIILIILLLIPITISIRINMTEQEIKLKLLFLEKSLYPILKKDEKEAENKIEKAEEELEEKKDFPEMLKFIWNIKDIVCDMLKAVLSYVIYHMIKIPVLRINGCFGTGDPAYTGMLCGVVYSSIYNVMGRLQNIVGKQEIDITPDFDDACIDVGLYTEIKTRTVHILVLIFIVLKYLVKIYLRKGKKR